MSRRFAALLASGLMLGLMGGCQDQDRYAKLKSSYDATISENTRLTQEMESLRNEINALQARLGEESSLTGAAGMTNAQLKARLAQLLDDYRKLEERLNGMGIALPAETDAALRALAEQHPDLIAYDAKRGMLRFKSDMTFALGSAEVQPQARQALQTLAGLLNGSAASNFDLRIVGHTDDVPISNPATARDHRTNTHLSAHRAIAVRDVMASSGVGVMRMEVAGWGEFRPAVPNRGRGGTTENRRVEIFLVPGMGATSMNNSFNTPSTSTSVPTNPSTPSGFETVK